MPFLQCFDLIYSFCFVLFRKSKLKHLECIVWTRVSLSNMELLWPQCFSACSPGMDYNPRMDFPSDSTSWSIRYSQLYMSPVTQPQIFSNWGYLELQHYVEMWYDGQVTQKDPVQKCFYISGRTFLLTYAEGSFSAQETLRWYSPMLKGYTAQK